MAAVRTYSIILEPMEEGWFLARVPALPEAVIGGDTVDEAFAMAKEAIKLVLEAALSAARNSLCSGLGGHRTSGQAEPLAD